MELFSAAPFQVIPSPQTFAVQAYYVICAWRADQMVDLFYVSLFLKAI